MMIGRTGLLSGGAIERFAANTDDMDYPRGGIVDVSAVAMIYADGPLTHTGNVAQSSLHTQQRLSQQGVGRRWGEWKSHNAGRAVCSGSISSQQRDINADRGLPHGVDLEAFQSVKQPQPHARYATRRSLWSNEPDQWEGAWIGNFNRNHSHKKLAITLEGFALAHADKVPNARLYLHGRAECTGPDLMREAHALGIADSALIPEAGGVSSKTLALLYWVMDMGINTSTREGWGLPAFEHAATGAPQIVPGHSARKELWRDAALLLTVWRNVNLAGWIDGGEVRPIDWLWRDC